MVETHNISLSNVLDVLARIISFNTESAKSNLELISWVEDYVRPFGVEFFRTTNKEGSKATLCLSRSSS